MLIYAKFSYIFQSLHLVDIPWSVPKSESTNMMSTLSTFVGLSTVSLVLAFVFRLHGPMCTYRVHASLNDTLNFLYTLYHI